MVVPTWQNFVLTVTAKASHVQVLHVFLNVCGGNTRKGNTARIGGFILSQELRKSIMASSFEVECLAVKKPMK